jgi:hypothetical protein
LNLERTLSDLVNQAYGLTPAEIELMWQTAPHAHPAAANRPLSHCQRNSKNCLLTPPPCLAGWGRNEGERKAILLHPRNAK